MEDWLLLREYVELGSEAAFARLVERHLPMVLGVCARELGDGDLAQDVAQAVFLILARKARYLRADVPLAGWLFQTARFAARNARRRERRRRDHEDRAGRLLAGESAMRARAAEWDDLEPLLHQALASLKAADREALLLRYFEDRSLKEIGAALGVSENGAHMRLTRAVERLRTYFQRRGFLISGTALATLLATEAPCRAAGSLSATTIAALAKGAETGGMAAAGIYSLTEGVLREMKQMLWRRFVLGSVVLLAAGGGLAAMAQALEPAKEAPVPPPATVGRIPTAAELLKRLSDGLEQRSTFIIRAEFTSISTSPGLDARHQDGWNEFRADPKTGRFVRRFEWWGDELNPDREHAAYNSQHWDGREYYTYTRARERSRDQVVLDRTGEANRKVGYLHQLRSGFLGAADLGYFRFDQDRIDLALAREGSLQVRPQTEKVGEVDCYVLQGANRFGRYTLWIDPVHGYQFARAEARKGAGDLVMGRPLTAGMEIRHTVEGIRFEKTAGVWVPMEAREEIQETFPERVPPTSVGKIHHTKTRVVLNPDFDALKAFQPDDIPDGCRVFLYGRKSYPIGFKGDYVWREGRLASPEP